MKGRNGRQRGNGAKLKTGVFITRVKGWARPGPVLEKEDRPLTS